MIVKVYAWIPRSHIHVSEVAQRINNTKLMIKDLLLEKEVSFKITEYAGFKDLSFVLDGDGLYSVSAKVKEQDVNDFYDAARKLLMNEVIRVCHQVTYSQIIEGILPINYYTAVLSPTDLKVKDYELIKVSGLKTYVNKSDAYTKNTRGYFCGSITNTIESVIDYYAFNNIMSRFFYEMMNKMESYHEGTKEVIRLLEYEPESDKLNNAYLNLDLVKKDAAESWAKVEQGIDCLVRKRDSYQATSLRGKARDLSHSLGVLELFTKLMADKDYTLSLWTLLINHLEYVDTAVEARVTFKNMKNNKASRWLGLVSSGFIIATVIIGLFIAQNPAFNNITNFVLFILGWLVFYELINYFILRKSS